MALGSRSVRIGGVPSGCTTNAAFTACYCSNCDKSGGGGAPLSNLQLETCALGCVAPPLDASASIQSACANDRQQIEQCATHCASHCVASDASAGDASATDAVATGVAGDAASGDGLAVATEAGAGATESGLGAGPSSCPTMTGTAADATAPGCSYTTPGAGGSTASASGTCPTPGPRYTER